MADKTAEAMAKAMGATIADDSNKDAGTDQNTDQDTDQNQDQNTGGDAGSAGDNAGDQGGDDNAGGDAGDSTSGDDAGTGGGDDQASSGDQVDDKGGSDQTKKVIPDSGNSDDEPGQSATFETQLTEHSSGRFKSIADIDKALEEVPEGTFASEQIAKINDYVKQGGSLEDFVRTQTVDYSSLNAYELIKAQRMMNSGDLTQEEIELEIEEDFGFTEGVDDRTKKVAGIKLKRAGADALKFLQDHQKTWAVPMAEQKQDRESNLAQWSEQLNGAVNNVNDIHVVLSKDSNFTFKLDDTMKESVKTNYKEIDKFFKRYVNSDGSENTEEFVRDMIKLEKFDEIVRSAASASKSQAKKDIVDDLKNPDFKGKDTSKAGGKKYTIEEQAMNEFFK